MTETRHRDQNFYPGLQDYYVFNFVHFGFFSVSFDFLCYTGFSNAEINYISLAEAITETLNAQSDQSSLCAQWTQAYFMQTVKTLIRLGRCPV